MAYWSRAAKSREDETHLGDEEGYGAPSATEIENVHSVDEFRFDAVRLEHEDFGLLERLLACRVEAARVLEVGAEAGLDKGSRNLFRGEGQFSCNQSENGSEGEGVVAPRSAGRSLRLSRWQ